MPSSLTLLLTILGVTILCPRVKALRCHDCGGSDYVPKAVLNTLMKLNITNVTQYGDCKSTKSACDSGQFCVKNTVSYRIGYNGLKYTWNTYTKSCVSPGDISPTPEFSLSNIIPKSNPTKSGACYTNSNNTGSTTVTTTTSICYCSDGDFCNSAVPIALMPAVAVLILRTLF